jgi:hypothetical protein
VLTEDERAKLLDAFVSWAGSAPQEPFLGFVGDDGHYSPLELVAEIEQRTETGEAFLEILEHGVRREGLEQVVRRFYESAERNSAATY